MLGTSLQHVVNALKTLPMIMISTEALALRTEWCCGQFHVSLVCNQSSVDTALSKLSKGVAGNVGSLESQAGSHDRRDMTRNPGCHSGFNRLSSCPFHPTQPPTHRLIKGRYKACKDLATLELTLEARRSAERVKGWEVGC